MKKELLVVAEKIRDSEKKIIAFLTVKRLKL